MSRLRRRTAIVAATLALAPIGAIAVGSSPAAAAEGTMCVPYSETTGACITQWYGEDGALHTILSFYWGNSWIDLPLA